MYLFQPTFLPLPAGMLGVNMAWSTTWQTNWFRDIATASIGPRSVVATGPGELEACQWEVEPDTERFIQIAEVR